MLAPGIHLFKGILPDSEEIITDIEDAAKERSIMWASAGVSYNNSAEMTDAKKVRDTDSFSVPYIPEENPTNPTAEAMHVLSNLFREAFALPIQQYTNFYGITPANYDHYQVLKYGIGQKFENHIDDSPQYPRTLSLTYYMNDAYEGGEIEFNRFGVKIKPEKHDLLLFPSNYVYNHRVHPVTSGTRYAVVQWAR